MEIFDVKRQDVLNFDNWMDLKKTGFGGPDSAEKLRDAKGKIVNKDRKLKNFQHTVERHELFNNQVFDSTYKAMGGDLVHKQEVGKNPYDYPDLYDNMGVATVETGKANEGMCYDFETFLLESEDNGLDLEKLKRESALLKSGEWKWDDLVKEYGEDVAQQYKKDLDSLIAGATIEDIILAFENGKFQMYRKNKNEFIEDKECEDCEEEEDETELKEGKKWISSAIKRPGALRKKLGKKEGEKISQTEINKKLKALDTDPDKPGTQTKGKANQRTVKQLNLAKTLKSL